MKDKIVQSYFWNYRSLIDRIKLLEEKIKRLENEICSCKGQNLNSDIPPCVTIGQEQRATKKIAELVDLKNQLEDYESECRSNVKEMESVINAVAQKYALGANILYERFLNCMSFENIAKKYSYCQSSIFNIYNQSLELAKEIILENKLIQIESNQNNQVEHAVN